MQPTISFKQYQTPSWFETPLLLKGELFIYPFCREKLNWDKVFNGESAYKRLK